MGELMDKVFTPILAQDKMNRMKVGKSKRRGVLDSLREGNLLHEKPKAMDVVDRLKEARKSITISINE